MYSRKYIRSLPNLPTPPRSDAEREVSLPPDYTGMAFREPIHAPRRDFPETVIADRSVMAEPSAEPVSEEPAEAAELPLEPVEELASISEEPEQSFPAQGEPMEELCRETPAPKDAPPSASAEPKSVPPEESAPLITPALLRSLTLEDLLLLWMLLMLLCSNQEDQVYLLLGLLLFTGR